MGMTRRCRASGARLRMAGEIKKWRRARRTALSSLAYGRRSTSHMQEERPTIYARAERARLMRVYLRRVSSQVNCGTRRRLTQSYKSRRSPQGSISPLFVAFIIGSSQKNASTSPSGDHAV